MGTTVTENASNSSNVDVVEDYTTGIVNRVDSYTQTKTAYLAKLNKEKDRIGVETAGMESAITNCETREAEIDTIITAVNNL